MRHVGLLAAALASVVFFLLTRTATADCFDSMHTSCCPRDPASDERVPQARDFAPWVKVEAEAFDDLVGRSCAFQDVSNLTEAIPADVRTLQMGPPNPERLEEGCRASTTRFHRGLVRFIPTAQLAANTTYVVSCGRPTEEVTFVTGDSLNSAAAPVIEVRDVFVAKNGDCSRVSQLWLSVEVDFDFFLGGGLLVVDYGGDRIDYAQIASDLTAHDGVIDFFFDLPSSSDDIVTLTPYNGAAVPGTAIEVDVDGLGADDEVTTSRCAAPQRAGSIDTALLICLAIAAVAQRRAAPNR